MGKIRFLEQNSKWSIFKSENETIYLFHNDAVLQVHINGNIHSMTLESTKKMFDYLFDSYQLNFDNIDMNDNFFNILDRLWWVKRNKFAVKQLADYFSFYHKEDYTLATQFSKELMDTYYAAV